LTSLWHCCSYSERAHSFLTLLASGACSVT